MILILIVAVYHFITQDWAKYCIYQVAERMSIDARLQSLQHLFTLNASWHEKENTGNKMRRIDRGGDSLNELLRMYVDLVVESTINLVGIGIIFYTFSWQHNALLMIFFVSYFLLSIYLTKKASKTALVANVQWEEFSGRAFESVNNIQTVKSLNLGRYFIGYLTRQSHILMQAIKKRIQWFRFRGASLNLHQEFFRQGIILYTVIGVFQGRFEVGLIAMVLLYFGKIRESAGELAEVANEFVISKIAVMRMKDILNEKPTIELSGRKTFDLNWKRITFKGVHFSYKGRKVLDDFSLQIRRGEKIGIVGLSGAGKSTLFKLLLKLHDGYEGSILFDQRALKDIKRKSFIQQVAVVPQETELFNFSLRENITLATTLNLQGKKRLKQALKVAHVHEFMPKLPQGIESPLGEKGVKLSGGEKQRVGIARAVFRQPQLLLLDEATSHLDIESEQKIQEALQQFFEKTTAIVIAHRLSTLRQMDRIVVIKGGRVAEEGAFASLIQKKGEFYRLWERQKF